VAVALRRLAEEGEMARLHQPEVAEAEQLHRAEEEAVRPDHVGHADLLGLERLRAGVEFPRQSLDPGLH
jgi:hypothetical protein